MIIFWFIVMTVCVFMLTENCRMLGFYQSRLQVGREAIEPALEELKKESDINATSHEHMLAKLEGFKLVSERIYALPDPEPVWRHWFKRKK